MWIDFIHRMISGESVLMEVTPVCYLEVCGNIPLTSVLSHSVTCHREEEDSLELKPMAQMKGIRDPK